MALQYDNPVWNNEFAEALADNPNISETTAAAITSVLGLDTDAVESVVVAGWDGVAADVTVPEGKTADVLTINYTGADGAELTLPESVADAKVIIIESDAGVELNLGEEASSTARLAIDAVATATRVIVGGNGDDVLTVTGSGNVVLAGGNGNNTLTTGSGDDVISAGTGINTIDAGAGNDTIVTGLGIDTIDAGEGRDTIQVEGLRADFAQSVTGDSLLLTGSNASVNTSVTLQNAEFVTFSDGATLAIAENEAQADALRLFQGLLGRDADTGGAEAFTNAVNNGTSLDDIAQSFLTSDEHYTNLRSDWLSDVYDSVLGRSNVDESGLDTWLNQFELGATRGEIFASIAAADEAGNLSDADYVSAVYDAALGREAEEGGLNNWVAALSSGMSRTDVANEIYNSAESNAHIAEDFVTSLFTNVGVTADENAVAGYELALAHGATQAEVAISIIGAAEDNITNVIVVQGAV